MIGLILALSTVTFVVISGIHYMKVKPTNPVSKFKKILFGSSLLLVLALITSPVSAFGAISDQGEVNGNAMIGVALSTGLAALGAGIAVGLTGSAAIGAISEDPRMLGRSLIFVGLAEGVAIYGLVISIMIFGRV